MAIEGIANNTNRIEPVEDPPLDAELQDQGNVDTEIDHLKSVDVDTYETAGETPTFALEGSDDFVGPLQPNTTIMADDPLAFSEQLLDDSSLAGVDALFNAALNAADRNLVFDQISGDTRKRIDERLDEMFDDAFERLRAGDSAAEVLTPTLERSMQLANRLDPARWNRSLDNIQLGLEVRQVYGDVDAFPLHDRLTRLLREGDVNHRSVTAMSNQELLSNYRRVTETAGILEATDGSPVTGYEYFRDRLAGEDGSLISDGLNGLSMLGAVTAPAYASVTGLLNMQADNRLRELQQEIDRRVSSGDLDVNAVPAAESQYGPLVGAVLGGAALGRLAVSGGKRVADWFRRTDETPSYFNLELPDLVSPQAQHADSISPAGIPALDESQHLGHGMFTDVYRHPGGAHVEKVVRPNIAGIDLSLEDRARIAARTVAQHDRLRELGFPVPSSVVNERMPHIVHQAYVDGLRFEDLAPQARMNAAQNKLRMIDLAEQYRDVRIDRGAETNPFENFRFDENGQILAWIDPAIPLDTPELNWIYAAEWARRGGW